MGIKKAVYIILGCLALSLGAVGAVLPILPTVPFLMIAAFCFAKSSSSLHDWFVNTKLYKNNLESLAKGRGMTARVKLRIIIAATLTMGVGFFLMRNAPVGRIIISVVWVLHLLYFLLGVKTIKNSDETEDEADRDGEE